MMLRRNSPDFAEKFNDCFRQMSYLAKYKSDDRIDSNIRKISYSRYNRSTSRSKD
jgi:hypothetical protein